MNSSFPKSLQIRVSSYEYKTITAYLFLCLFFFQFNIYGQLTYPEKQYKNQIEIGHDNDFFVVTDRYYSSGLFLTYRKLLKNTLVTPAEQLEFSLAQEMYTPKYTLSTDVNDFDRPYAGFLGVTTKWSAPFKNQMSNVAVLVGLAGPASGAGQLQKWYHKAVAISDSPLWIDELNNSFHLNIYYQHVFEWKLAPNPFGIFMAFTPKLAAGSRDIYIQPEGVFYFGRRNELKNSIAYNRLGSNNREIYFSLRFAYRSVFYNGLIQGNGFNTTSSFTTESAKYLFIGGFDFNHRFNKNDFKVGIRYNTKETPLADKHIYFKLGYALAF